MKVRQVLREPLLHFLLIGLALFALYGHVAPGDRDSHRIVVSQAQVDDIVRQYESLWGTPPPPEQLIQLVDSQIRDEILYREGQALGLDRDDTVIKRRVRQKLEVIAEEDNARDPPTDAELGAYLVLHADAFTQPGTVSFQQIYLGAARSVVDTDRAIAAVRSALAGGADPATLGEASMLPRSGDNITFDVVGSDFGEAFAKQLAAVPIAQWFGPVESSFGVHLVRVGSRTEPAPPTLDAVRTLVAREWENDRRKRALEANYRALRDTYEVVMEAKLPDDAPP